MDSNLHFRIILAFCLVSLHIHHCSTKSIPGEAVDQNTREKRESGCCRDKKEGEGAPAGSDNKGDCCQNEEGQDGDCCQIGNKEHGDGGGCCQDENKEGQGGGDCCGEGCCHDEEKYEDPCTYNTSNVQSEELSGKTQLPEVKPDPPKVEILKEAMMKNLLGEAFIEKVREADENTLLLFATMLAKLQSHMENLKFQADEVRNDLQLKFQGFDNWASHTDRVLDSAIAVVRKRVYEVQWAGKKHSDFKYDRIAD